MSQFPVESNDQLYDAVNYLLSGPGGLGQDFNGIQKWAPGWITGNFRIPYTQDSVNHNCTGTSGDTFVSCNPDAFGVAVGMTVVGYGVTPGTTVASIGSGTATGVQVNLSAAITEDIDNDLYFYPAVIPQLYIAPIALGTSTLLDPQTWKFEFATPQAAPPFSRGNPIIVAGVSDSIYDGEYAPVGVVECTTTYVIAKTTASYTASGPGTGGTVEYYQTSNVPSVFALSTDCNSKIVVNGGTDRVFISAQLTNQISYTASTSSDLNYAVAINRYKGFPNNDLTNPGYLFVLDKLIAKKIYSYSGLTGTGTLDSVDTIFSTFPDSNITTGYYWYIMDVSFQVTNGGDLQVTESELGLRSMSTQVVKQ